MGKVRADKEYPVQFSYRGVPRKNNSGFPKAGLVAGVLTQPLQTLVKI